MTNPPPGRAGRRRDPSRDVAILDAALDVLAEAGYAGLTMDAVAAAAGAGKATVYRRWDSKPALVLDAIRRLDAGVGDPAALPDTGSLRDDLAAVLARNDGSGDARRLRVMAGLTSMLAEHPALADAADAAIIEPWAAVNRVLIERAVARREIAAPLDIDALARLVPTMAAYRVCIQRKPIPNDYVASLIDAVLLPALGLHSGH